jgi:hypothetical protein
MREIAPGLVHWTGRHPKIGIDVSSYQHLPARVVIDPLVPAEGLDAVAARGAPELVLLTSRNHYRHSDRFAEAFGCPARCHESGLYEFTHGEKVEPFAFGDELAQGIVAQEVGSLSSDETAFHLADVAALAVADGVIRTGDGPLEFVPGRLMGDDPEEVRAGLLRAFRRLLELDFDTLLLAHGDPVVGDGKDALARFVEEPRTAEW